jgi:hypothetical protein
MDIVTRSDPMCTVYSKNSKNELLWYKFGHTETRDDDLNPDFVKSFNMNYYFEKHQPLKFEVIDDDGDLNHDLIGEAETSLGFIIGQKGSTLVLDLSIPSSTKSRGKIIIRAETIKESRW